MSAPPAGPFHYHGPEGFEAWGFRFPSGFIILEWIPESVPEDEQTIEDGHQSVYHTYEDFRATCTGDIEWGRTPLEDDSLEFSECQLERFEAVREEWTDDELPEPTDDQVLKSLLDTREAAANGHYSGDGDE